MREPPTRSGPHGNSTGFLQRRPWAYQHLGLAGTVLLALVGGFFVWTQWDKVSSWPGVHAIIELASRAPVPKTDPEHFSVLVPSSTLTE